jgi:hemoglobin
VAASDGRTLFARLGGVEALTLAVEKLYARILADGELRGFFAKVDIDRLRSRQVQFFAQALGGPAQYTGRTMREAHGHLPIEQRHFDRVAEHLATVLREMKVASPLVGEVLAAVAPLSAEIVRRK